MSLERGVRVDVRDISAWAARILDNCASEQDLRLGDEQLDALDLLPGWYDDWTIIERERLRQRILHAVEALSAQLARIGRFGAAIEAAITAINAEPLRESAQRMLIEAHLGEANWGEAHRAFVRYQELARRELGINPSRELHALLFDSVQQAPGRVNAPVHRPVSSRAAVASL